MGASGSKPSGLLELAEKAAVLALREKGLTAVPERGFAIMNQSALAPCETTIEQQFNASPCHDDGSNRTRFGCTVDGGWPRVWAERRCRALFRCNGVSEVIQCGGHWLPTFCFCPWSSWAPATADLFQSGGSTCRSDSAVRVNESLLQTPISFGSLLKRLDIGAKSAVNIGARDGQTHDPIYPLFASGYSGVAIEADARWNETLRLAFANFSGRVTHEIQFVNATNIASLLNRHETPRGLAALKVDIDSLDLPVLQAILEAGYTPAVLMAEINPDVPPPFSFYVSATPGLRDFEGFYGTSLQALYDLLRRHDFALVQIENQGQEHNAWFVHRSHLARGGLGALTQEQMVAQFFAAYPLQSSNPHGTLEP